MPSLKVTSEAAIKAPEVFGADRAINQRQPPHFENKVALEVSLALSENTQIDSRNPIIFK